MREVEYKNYQIKASAERTLMRSDWRATYEVRQQQRQVSPKVTGTVAGAFHSSEEAEDAAIKAGRLWIDAAATP